MLPIIVAESQAIAENEANHPQYEVEDEHYMTCIGGPPPGFHFSRQNSRLVPTSNNQNQHQNFEDSQASTYYSIETSTDTSTYQESSSPFCTSSHPKVNLFLYVATYVAFMAFGACIFSLIEQPGELRIREQLIRKQNEFLAKHPCVDRAALNELLEYAAMAKERGMTLKQLDRVSDRSSTLTPAVNVLDKISNTQPASQVMSHLARKLQSIEEDSSSKSAPKSTKSVESNKPESVSTSTHRPSTRQAAPSSHKRPSDTSSSSSKQTQEQHEKTNSGPQMRVSMTSKDERLQWEFTSSLMFVTSIMTTIGYGHVTPSTQLGKVFTIIYSSIGIPATLTLMSAFVALIIRGPVNSFEACLYRLMTAIRRLRFVTLFTLRMVHLFIITAVLLSICFFIPALIFMHFEDNWTYLDALYCCFISLTTIGLGDFVPSLQLDHAGYFELAIYRVATIVYLYFGLIMIMLWLALIYRIPQLNFEKLLLPKDCESDPAKMTGPSWGSSPPPSSRGYHSDKLDSCEKSRILGHNSMHSDYSSMMASPRNSVSPSSASSVTGAASVSSRSSSFSSMMNMMPRSASPMSAAGSYSGAHTASASTSHNQQP